MDVPPSASQGSQDALVPSTELSRPSTPKPSSAPGSASPCPENIPKMASQDRVRFTSPAPPVGSSMTPPPSSQVPKTRDNMRTPTPATPQLTSPPPTSKLSDQPSALSEPAVNIYSQDQINTAPAEELRSMVSELTSALRDVRLSAAHYKLQYNMAVMESQEAASRMAVELAMAQREIDVLQQAEEKRRSTIVTAQQTTQESPANAANAANAIMLNELNRQCQMLSNENEELKDLVEQQKRITEHREGEIASVMEENNRLKTRIRNNRDHIAPFLPYLEQMNGQGSPRSAFGTPNQAASRNRNHVPSVPALAHDNSRGQSNFEALLLADKMLSQETATAPPTPLRTHAPKFRFGHNRGTHSMSSLPQTPNRRSTHVRTDVPRTPPTFTPANSVPLSAPPAHYQQKPTPVRRQSSNSTITASSVDDEEACTDREAEEIEVPESQASQMATSMLRRTVPPKPMAAPSQQSSNLMQSKIFGQVKKGHGLTRSGEAEKRRLHFSGHHGSPTKRGRTDTGVGLGIGGLLRRD